MEQLAYLGLDFGTATTKVVVQLFHPDPAQCRFLAYAWPAPVAGFEPYLCPSAIAVDNDYFLFGHLADGAPIDGIVRSFKTCLACQAGLHASGHACANCLPGRPGYFEIAGRAVSAEDLSALFLADVLRAVKSALWTGLAGRAVQFRTHIAAPAGEALNDARLRATYERVIGLADVLSDRAANPWKVDDALAALASARGRPQPAAGDEGGTRAVSATDAAIRGVLPALRRDGQYVIVDVGAGTTNIAFFLRRTVDDAHAAAQVIVAETAAVGMDLIDHALEPHLAPAPGGARRGREHMADTTLSRHARRYGPIVERMYAHFRHVFGEAYAVRKGAEHYHDRYNQARFTLCLLGGGTRFHPVDERFRHRFPLFGQELNVPVEHPDVPATLELLADTGEVTPCSDAAAAHRFLLLPALGLARDVVTVPQWASDDVGAPAHASAAGA